MALKGQAKKEYQRDYMRRRRQGLTKPDVRGNRSPTLVCLANVRPVPKPVRPLPDRLEYYRAGIEPPFVDADGNPIYED